MSNKQKVLTASDFEIVEVSNSKSKRANNENIFFPNFSTPQHGEIGKRFLDIADGSIEKLHEIQRKQKEEEDAELDVVMVGGEGSNGGPRSHRFRSGNNYVKYSLKRKGSKYSRVKKFKRKTPKGSMNLLEDDDGIEKSTSARRAKEEKMMESWNKKRKRDDDEDDEEKSQDEESDEEEAHATSTSKRAQSSISKTAVQDLSNVSSSQLHELLKKNFGYDSFRKGQEEAITRILQNKSTLLIIPTGQGKSICYQIPALLVPDLVLVISPLISLMKDQLEQLPPSIPGAMLSSGEQQTTRERDQIYEAIRKRMIKVLFISPERMLNEKFIEAATTFPISFACIDESHCLSDWSHNFRSSYLHIKDVLQKRLGVKTLLALTATATKATEHSIATSLNIPSEGIIRTTISRDNLLLSMSRSTNREVSLMTLLRGERLKDCKSIIIYTMLKADADRVAEYLRANEMDAICYHAGLPAKDRASIQKKFIDNEVRIIVATVAFGMGINKQDVSAIIHYNLPRSMEHYIQEIGRAGRNGETAHCHLFLNDEDYIQLRSFAHSDTVDLLTMQTLVSKVFSKQEAAKEAETAKRSKEGGSKRQRIESSQEAAFKPYEVVLNIKQLEAQLDVKQEVISTVFSYLELHESRYVTVLPSMNTTYKIFFNQHTDVLSRTSNVVKAILQVATNNSSVHKNSTSQQQICQLDLFKLAQELGTTVSNAEVQIQALQDLKEIRYEVIREEGQQQEAFCIRVNKPPENNITLAKELLQKMRAIERNGVFKLDYMYYFAHKIASTKYETQLSPSFQAQIQADIESYFTMEQQPTATSTTSATTTELESKIQQAIEKVLTFEIAEKLEQKLKQDIRTLIRSSPESVTNGKIIARILHGIQSPSFTSTEWARSSFWKRYQTIDFYKLVSFATKVLVEYKQNK